MSNQKKPSSTVVMVLGGGVAGTTIAGELAAKGIETHLIEKTYAIGGHAARFGCKAGQTCVKCGVCVYADQLRSLKVRNNLHCYMNSELTACEAAPDGKKAIKWETNAPYIDPIRCNGCGVCEKTLPSGAVVRRKPYIGGRSWYLDPAKCPPAEDEAWGKAVRDCPNGAIQVPGDGGDIEADALVVATGFQPYDPSHRQWLGYGVLPNVIDGIEAEQQILETGSLIRPSDGQRPKRVAFVQCVGSRTDEAQSGGRTSSHCSIVCCSYALRMSGLMAHQDETTELTIFHIDIQKLTKGFKTLYDQVIPKVRLVHGIPAWARPADNDNVLLLAEALDNGKKNTSSQSVPQEFDLVVLSVGMRPRPEAQDLADMLGLEMNESGFFNRTPLRGSNGQEHCSIYLTGTCRNPMSIGTTIEDALTVAGRVASQLRG